MSRLANRRVWTGRALTAAAAVAAAPLSTSAQLSAPTLSSETGVYAEAYRISGRPSRRPDQTVRFYASPTVSWMGMSLGANLLWSTENQFAAQTLNRYYLNPRWSWGQLHAGDYVPTVSRYTANSVRVRGGGVELTPWRLRFGFTGGRVQDATDLSTFDAAPERTLFAGVVGIGDPAATFLEISALRAEDSGDGADTLSAPPQENVVAAGAGGLVLFDGRLRFTAEGAASLFSRDTRAGELENVGQPEWTGELFTPRVSSRLDYAWTAEARVALRTFSFGAQVEQVGPGFTSLGNPYSVNDRREARLLGTFRLLRGRLSGNASVGQRRDNLADDKHGTTYRRTGTLGLTAALGRAFVSAANVMVNGTTRDPVPTSPTGPDPGMLDSLRLKNVAVSVSLVQQVRYPLMGLTNQVTLSLTEQRIEDASPRFGGLLDTRSRAVALDYGVLVRQFYMVSLRPAYQEFRGASGSERLTSLSLGVSRRAPGTPLTASTLSTYTQLRDGWQLRQDANVSYRLTERDNLSAQARWSALRGVDAPFTETLLTMRWSHRW
jgi:hypothetical protein